jgi:hypothetical protein
MRADRTMDLQIRSFLMQRTKPNPTQQQPVQKTSAPKGPTPIDPRHFKHVAGGLPKSGWGTSGVVDTSV